MTEDEATTKWCPFVRYAVSAEDNNAANRWGKNDTFANPSRARCIGSACMAWRWQDRRYVLAMEEFEDSKNIGGINTREEPKVQGFCGLAGSPDDEPELPR